jgi:glyoxylase-like metal-dependent hydrolase (beta-lactamase superfamily II)
MIFSLEALKARHGDSLILHFGDESKPQLVVIDGGPSGVYKEAFRPRLDEVAAKLAPGGQLPIEILMISHIDDDHIRGVLDLSDRLVQDRGLVNPPFDVRTLWHNSFDDLVGDDAEELRTGLEGASGGIASAEGPPSAWVGQAEAVVASVPQGRQLRDNARVLGWTPNDHFATWVTAPEQGGVEVKLGSLTLTVVCPLLPQLEALQHDWSDKLRELKKAKRAKDAAAVAEFLDDSVYNLSSIVCLAECEGRRILLTGDARGDHIMAGLRAAKLLGANDVLDVDILKLPHHGSDRNVTEAFFRTIKADHYVASGNGKFHNPEVATLRMLTTARADDDFELWLTYEDAEDGVGAELKAFFDQQRQAGRKYGVNFRADDALSLRIDLLAPVTY